MTSPTSIRCRTFFPSSVFGMLGGGAIKEDRGKLGSADRRGDTEKGPEAEKNRQ